MVKIKANIIITGIICLTAIYLTLTILDHDTTIAGNIIIFVIALSIGVVIPTPKADNKRGILKW